MVSRLAGEIAQLVYNKLFSGKTAHIIISGYILDPTIPASSYTISEQDQALKLGKAQWLFFRDIRVGCWMSLLGRTASFWDLCE